jgi:hypothetical protein
MEINKITEELKLSYEDQRTNMEQNNDWDLEELRTENADLIK